MPMRHNREFQSTHSRGVRLNVPPMLLMDETFQSTHSRGVRLPTISVRTSIQEFQSTHSRGVRPIRLSSLCIVCWFQSTHSRGVRQNFKFFILWMQSFNPRTHEECDSGLVVTAGTTYVSIHALTRSATDSIGMQQVMAYVSIHALTRSATVRRSVTLM